MRIISFFLVLSFGLFLKAAPKMNVFQARGLTKGKCYQEMASLNCKEACTLDLFPTTQAQITLNIKDISKKDRMKMGHLFKVKFKVLNKEANEIQTISVSRVSTNDFFTSIKSSNGKVAFQNCK